jgi:hypothetical protein
MHFDRRWRRLAACVAFPALFARPCLRRTNFIPVSHGNGSHADRPRNDSSLARMRNTAAPNLAVTYVRFSCRLDRTVFIGCALALRLKILCERLNLRLPFAAQNARFPRLSLHLSFHLCLCVLSTACSLLPSFSASRQPVIARTLVCTADTVQGFIDINCNEWINKTEEYNKHVKSQ